MTCADDELPPQEFLPVAVDSMHRVLNRMATGETVWGAAVAEISNRSDEYLTAIIRRVMALTAVLGTDLQTASDSLVAAAATCRCTAAWATPAQPRFDLEEFRTQHLLMMPIGGHA